VKLYGSSVLVKDGNVDRALRKLKKKLTESGLFNDIRANEFYEKPTTAKKRQRSAAKNRWQQKQRAQELPKKLY
jgi:small subunit ribosomal protein S21